jgi:POT family proton-dependent oligopeptide transporter
VDFTPLRRILVGFGLAVAAFAISAHAQGLIDTESARLAAGDLGSEAARWPSVTWQLAAYVVITAAEILVSITCLEFSYTQAPPQMKSLVMSLYLLSVSLGNLFTAAVNWLTRDGSGESTLAGASYYWFFTGCMAVATVLLVPVVLLYKPREYLQQEADGPTSGSS